MSTPFFSIIMPTYNRGAIIENSVNSVRNQVFTDWELLIIDDASTDDTESVVLAFSKLDPRIKLYRNLLNLKVSHSRNVGIRNARGKYLCFLDSDDLYHMNHLLNFYTIIIEGVNGMLCSDYRIIGKTSIIPIKNNLDNQTMSETKWLKVFLPNSPPVQTICIPNRDNLFFNENLNLTECYEFCARCGNLYQIIFTDEITVDLIVHDNNLSIHSDEIRLLDFYKNQYFEFKLMIKYDLFKSIRNTVEFEAKLTSLISNVMILGLKLKKQKYILKMFWEAFKWGPRVFTRVLKLFLLAAR